MIRQALEEEITELLGRMKSERRAAVDAPPGYWNGYGKPRRLAMSSGTIAAVEIPEADAPYAAMTPEVAAPAACAGLASLTGEVGATISLGIFACPDGVEEAASQAAAAECGQHGQVIDELTIDCRHLGGGYWSYTATFSCKEPETNLW